jgi:proteasome lid subunit RPN8/RPN11
MTGLWRHALRAVFAHARDAYPEECCGYFVDTPDQPMLYRLPNAAPRRGDHRAGSSFVVDDVEALVAFDRRLRQAHREDHRVVFYHSHPDGRACWSDADAQAWTTPWGPSWQVDQLVVALTRFAMSGAALYRYDHDCALFVEQSRWTGTWLSADATP